MLGSCPSSRGLNLSVDLLSAQTAVNFFKVFLSILVSIATMSKILLVEDNELNRDMLSRRLTRKGFDVAIAVDGEQGIQLATSEKPDLILMDMSLPIIDGLTATQTLKGNSDTSHIPIIALTAHAMASDREKALAAGCDDYDTKPIEFKRLLEKIQAFLPS
jgi:two-component system response regulator